MKAQKICLDCKKELSGRADKKFCDVYCKSAYHYKLRQQTPNFYIRVDQQLKKNRKILKYSHKSGKGTVRVQTLMKQGFSPDFFTHYWKNNNGDVYLFVYEFGFLKKIKNGEQKYILVTWQPYMKK